MLSLWRGRLSDIQQIVRLNHLREELDSKNLRAVLKLAESWPLAATHLALVFEFAWYNQLLRHATTERRELARFDGATHEVVRQRFVDADKSCASGESGKDCSDPLAESPASGAYRAMNVLLHEFNKRRRHLPIRRLVQQAGNAVQGIKPGFMMSPLSVAHICHGTIASTS